MVIQEIQVAEKKYKRKNENIHQKPKNKLNYFLRHFFTHLFL